MRNNNITSISEAINMKKSVAVILLATHPSAYKTSLMATHSGAQPPYSSTEINVGASILPS